MDQLRFDALCRPAMHVSISPVFRQMFREWERRGRQAAVLGVRLAGMSELGREILAACPALGVDASEDLARRLTYRPVSEVADKVAAIAEGGR